MAYTDDAKYVDLYDKVGKTSLELKKADANITFTRNKYGEGSELEAAKARYTAAKAADDAADSAWKARKKEIDDAAAKSKKKKDDTKAQTAAQADIKILEYKLQQAKDRGDTATVAALQEQINAEKPTAAGTPAVSSDTSISTGLFTDYTYNNDGTVTGKDGKPGIFVMKPDDKGNFTPEFYTSKAAGRDAFLKQYAKPGDIDKLKEQLLASGYIKQSQIADGTWVTGIDDMLVNYTVKAVSDTKYNNVKEPISMADYLKLKKVGSGGTGSTSYRVITTRGDAKKLLDNYLTDLRGSGGTPQEQEDFYNQLHTAENQAVATTVKGTTTGSVLADADRLMLAASVARKSLKGTNVESLLTSKGSQVTMDIATLQEFASNYGIDMPAADALKYIAAGLGQKDYLAKQEERIRQLAVVKHPYLKDHIAAGGTVKDVADQYKYAKQNKLGIVIPDSTKDQEIMDAVAKNVTISDYNRAQQKNPLWREGEEAHNLAANFAQTILKSFGFIG